MYFLERIVQRCSPSRSFCCFALYFVERLICISMSVWNFLWSVITGQTFSGFVDIVVLELYSTWIIALNRLAVDFGWFTKWTWTIFIKKDFFVAAWYCVKNPDLEPSFALLFKLRLHYQYDIDFNIFALNIYLVMQTQILQWIQQQGVHPDW